MDTLSRSQITLLVRAATDGAVTDKRSAKTAQALIDLDLLIAEGDDDGERWRITDAGRAAVGIAGAAPEDTSPDAGPAPQPIVGQAAAPQPKGKIATLIGLLERADGASLAVMMTATGWQAHSVRGALSGAIKAKLGLTVTSEKADGVRIYRIERSAMAQGDA